ncbi:unnamed protein product [Schistosoma haematobium]|nr:unnamed protein product [Schistosoma haematobium]CAH8620083.1 unnamed protein product [Schistosoma haematobium]
MAELKIMMDKEKPDYIAMSETWLTSEVLDNDTQLTGISSSRADRLNGIGGRVILYTKRTPTITAVETVVRVSGTCELVRCKLKCRR